VNGTVVTGITGATYTYAPANNDVITCQVTSNATCATGSPATSNSLTMTVIPLIPVSITISASANPVSVGTPVTFTGVPVNGGTPAYQWKQNGTFVTGATNATYAFTPTSNSTVSITCSLTSSLTGCLSGNPVLSNLILFYVANAADSCPNLADITYPASGGKTYNTVQIGTQCWFRENLDVGTRINKGQFPANNSTIEKWCYNDLTSNCDIYGGLYDWNELMQYTTTAGTKGICPDGWHIPTDAEFLILANYLGGNSVAGGKMKETGTAHFLSPNTGATNSSGFTALPNGYLYNNTASPYFSNIKGYGYFYTSTLYASDPSWALCRNVSYPNTTSGSIPSFKNTTGGVRCLKN